VDERTRRIGLNEALFREVNERVDSLARGFGIDDDRLELLCECGDPSCVDRIAMPAGEYAQLRADSRTFAVVPGHDIPDVERVVERHDGYDVVMKEAADAVRIAEETDPRT
jgi:hypothetical protein